MYYIIFVEIGSNMQHAMIKDHTTVTSGPGED